jgi:hypothetical protein
MKLNPCDFSHERNHENSDRRKKEQDAIRIDAAIKTALDELHDHEERRAAFVALLTCVRLSTPLLKPTPGRGTRGWVAPAFLINRLKNLAMRQHHWIRSCETWQPRENNLRLAFRSLAHHLLAYYPVPGGRFEIFLMPGYSLASTLASWVAGWLATLNQRWQATNISGWCPPVTVYSVHESLETHERNPPSPTMTWRNPVVTLSL